MKIFKFSKTLLAVVVMNAVTASSGVADDLCFEKSVAQLQDEFNSGKLSSVQLVDYYLKRIKVYDGVINSMITINPKAMAEAKRLDDERAHGHIEGPLHGIPIVLKDNYDTFDMPTTSGALAFKDLVPAKDAFTVEKLRKAGAIFIGKSNLTEIANHGMTISSMGGQTLNPYDLTRTPGGSSGGTGAAVAANFAVMGTGSDTVNSIRSPSSANSLVGIRPTKGLVSRTGISPCSDFQDMGGPIARSVEDAAVMLKVMAGYDAEDKSTEIIKERQLDDYSKALKKGSLKGKRLGLITNNMGNDPAVMGVLNQAVADLKKLGAEVVDADIPELFLPKLIKEHDVQKWEQARDLDAYLKREGDAAPVKNTKEYVATGLLTASIVDDFKMKSAVIDPDNDPEYQARIKKNLALRDFVVDYMHKHDLDAFVYPLQGVLVVKTTEPKGQYARNGLMASVTGLPAIDVPGGFSKPDDTAPLGVPVGIEFMAEPFSESKLIGMAFDYEQATKHRKAPEGLPDLDFSSVSSK